MNCVKIGCQENAYYLIVYGCLNAHIRELLLCFHHGEEWALQQSNLEVGCTQCREPIDSYEFRWTDKLKGKAWS